jgi:hypothetical protein
MDIGRSLGIEADVPSENGGVVPSQERVNDDQEREEAQEEDGGEDHRLGDEVERGQALPQVSRAGCLESVLCPLGPLLQSMRQRRRFG